MHLKKIIKIEDINEFLSSFMASKNWIFLYGPKKQDPERNISSMINLTKNGSQGPNLKNKFPHHQTTNKEKERKKSSKIFNFHHERREKKAINPTGKQGYSPDNLAAAKAVVSLQVPARTRNQANHGQKKPKEPIEQENNKIQKDLREEELKEQSPGANKLSRKRN